MTLFELVDGACAKLHRNDNETQLEAKKYARYRYQMIWNSRPWRDALNLMMLPLSDDQIIYMPGICDRVVCVRWGLDSNLFPKQLIDMFIENPSEFEEITSPSNFSLISPSGLAASPAGEKLIMSSNNENASFIVGLRGIWQNNQVTEQVAVEGGSTSTSQFSYDEVFSLAKNSSAFPLNVKNEISLTNLLDLTAEETHLLHQRIHLFVTPIEAKTQFAIYKRRCNQLIYDSDSVEISGIDLGLQAAIESDLLEGQRQYGKAQMKGSEAGALIQAAADMETHQSAHIIRMIPWDGGGDDTWELTGKGYL